MSQNLPKHITPRFPFLNLAAALLRNLAYLVIGVAIAIWLYSMFAVLKSGNMVGLIPAFIMLFWLLVVSLLMMIIAEVIHVLLAIEENTRRTTDALTGERTGTTPRRLE